MIDFMKDILAKVRENPQRVVNAICKKYESRPMSAEDWTYAGGIWKEAGDGGLWVPIEVYITCDDIEAADADPAPDDYRCPVHAGEIHGAEAEELRAGIECILDDDSFSDDELRTALRRLLEEVDARDSLAEGENYRKLQILARTAERAEEFTIGEAPSLLKYKDKMVRASDIIDILDGKLSM